MDEKNPIKLDGTLKYQPCAVISINTPFQYEPGNSHFILIIDFKQFHFKLNGVNNDYNI